MNKVILVGNLTRDVELSATPSGTSYAKFSLAINRPFTNSEGEHDVDYINIVAWRDLADRCAQYLSKGKKVCVVGMLQTRSYDAQDGTKRYVTEVVASEVEFLTPKGESAAPQAPPQKTATQKSRKSSLDELEPVEGDDLPF